jgi:shikimate dehydrogenase
MTRQFGIIGNPLTHSFSPGYFTQKFRHECIDAEYKAYPLDNISDFEPLINSFRFNGLNVTLPFKEHIIPFLDRTDEIAAQIGAVNTIKFDSGKNIGYNTDVFGFQITLLDLIQTPDVIQKAMVLGTGGASKAVIYVLKSLAIPYFIVSRRTIPDFLHYDDITPEVFSQVNLIINTTPLGMYPEVNTRPEIPYHLLNKNYFLYDLVYNPEKTIFLSEGLSRGSKVMNGYNMLIHQADKAWEIWNQ